MNGYVPPGYIRIQREYFRLPSKSRKFLALIVDLSICAAILYAARSLPDGITIVLVLACIGYLQTGRGFLHGQTAGDRLLDIIALDAVHGVPCTPFQCMLAHGKGSRLNLIGTLIAIVMQAAKGDHNPVHPIITVCKGAIPWKTFHRSRRPSRFGRLIWAPSATRSAET